MKTLRDVTAFMEDGSISHDEKIAKIFDEIAKARHDGFHEGWDKRGLFLRGQNKRCITTLDGFRMEEGRAKGNTTRLADKAIQLLFEGNKVACLDIYRFGSDRQSNMLLMNKILRRLRVEHDIDTSELIIDDSNYTIDFKSSQAR